jgi:hypothetical protein
MGANSGKDNLLQKKLHGLAVKKRMPNEHHRKPAVVTSPRPAAEPTSIPQTND